ncbi:hypothetical protein ACHAXT_009145 [Thalassiosira profunda]
MKLFKAKLQLHSKMPTLKADVDSRPAQAAGFQGLGKRDILMEMRDDRYQTVIAKHLTAALHSGLVHGGELKQQAEEALIDLQSGGGRLLVNGPDGDVYSELSTAEAALGVIKRDMEVLLASKHKKKTPSDAKPDIPDGKTAHAAPTPCPSIGEGWTQSVVSRSGSTVSDRYYFSPKGKKFRSKAEVTRYLNRTGKGAEDAAINSPPSQGAAQSARKNAAEVHCPLKGLSGESQSRDQEASSRDGDIVLSWKKDAYRKKMFAHFKGGRADVDAIIDEFKKESGNGSRFFTISQANKYCLINEQRARERIRMDISQRNRYKKEWSESGPTELNLEPRDGQEMHAAARANPNRFIKQKNSNNLYYKDTMELSRTVRYESHNVIEFYPNPSFDVTKLDNSGRLSCIGQHIAKFLLETSSEWAVEAWEASSDATVYITYKKDNEYGSEEGVDKFTGYAALAKWSHTTGLFDSNVVNSEDGMEFLRAIGVQDPLRLFDGGVDETTVAGEESTKKRRKGSASGKKKKRRKSGPRRKSAWTVFLPEFSQKHRLSGTAARAGDAGQAYRALSKEQKAEYDRRANEANDELFGKSGAGQDTRTKPQGRQERISAADLQGAAAAENLEAVPEEPRQGQPDAVAGGAPLEDLSSEDDGDEAKAASEAKGSAKPSQVVHRLPQPAASPPAKDDKSYDDAMLLASLSPKKAEAQFVKDAKLDQSEAKKAGTNSSSANTPLRSNVKASPLLEGAKPFALLPKPRKGSSPTAAAPAPQSPAARTAKHVRGSREGHAGHPAGPYPSYPAGYPYPGPYGAHPGYAGNPYVFPSYGPPGYPPRAYYPGNPGAPRAEVDYPVADGNVPKKASVANPQSPGPEAVLEPKDSVHQQPAVNSQEQGEQHAGKESVAAPEAVAELKDSTQQPQQPPKEQDVPQDTEGGAPPPQGNPIGIKQESEESDDEVVIIEKGAPSSSNVMWLRVVVSGNSSKNMLQVRGSNISFKGLRKMIVKDLGDIVPSPFRFSLDAAGNAHVHPNQERW